MTKKKNIKGRKSAKKSKKRDLSKKSSQNRTMLIYYASVLGFAFAYHLISNQDWFMSMAKPVFMGYASICSFLLNIFGENTVAQGIDITSTAFSLTIKEGCDAITPIILFSMAIIAFPISFKLKWPGLGVGILALFLLNIVRIITLYYVGKHCSQEFFDFMHIDVWQILFLILTVFAWLIWMRWALITKAQPVKSE